MRPFVRLLVVLGSTCVSFSLAARVEECRAAASRKWSATERNVWNDLCEGKVAVAGNGADRGVIRARFIEEILLDSAYSTLIPHRGVRIEYADVQGPLHLANSHIAHELWLDQSVLRGELDLYNAELAHSLSLEGSVLHGRLRLANARVGNQILLTGARALARVDMESAVVDRNVFLNGAHFRDVVHLRRLSAGDQITAFGSHFEKECILDGARISGLLLFGDVTATEVVLRGAVIGDSVAIDGRSKIAKLSADNLEVARTFRIRSTGTPSEIEAISLRNLAAGVVDLGCIRTKTLDLDGARVRGALDVHGLAARTFTAPFAQVEGRLRIKDSKIDDVDLRAGRIWHVEVRNTAIASNLSAPYATIDDAFMIAENVVITGKLDLGSLRADAVDLSGGTYTAVDLARADLRSHLSVGNDERRATWGKHGSLSLINARTDALHDHQDAWPKRLALDGFVYERWGMVEPFRAASAAAAKGFIAFRDRKDDWFTRWLGAQDQLSVQSYLQLASAFRHAGLEERAVDFQYAARERERVNTTGLKYLALTFSKALTGYGFRYERSLLWVILFVICGWVVLHFTGQSRQGNTVIGVAYSLDMFLPIVQLRKAHQDVDLNPPARYYFYVHRLAGFVIGTFVLAALAGFR